MLSEVAVEHRRRELRGSLRGGTGGAAQRAGALLDALCVKQPRACPGLYLADKAKYNIRTGSLVAPVLVALDLRWPFEN